MERTAAFKFDRVFPGIGWLWCVAGLPAEGAAVRAFLIVEFFPGVICQFRDLKTVIEDEKGVGTGIQRIADCPPECAGAKVEFHLGLVHINGFLSVKRDACWQGAARFSGAASCHQLSYTASSRKR